MPATRSSRVSATTKSSPLSLNASTGPVAPLESRWRSSSRTLFPVRSGFCSWPESANSFSMIAWVSTNQEWSWPLARSSFSVPSVSKPGSPGSGRRVPEPSSHSDDGPGRIRIPCSGQIGSQFLTPST